MSPIDSNPVESLGYIKCYSSNSPQNYLNPTNSINYNYINYNWGEWPSGLRRYTENWKDPTSNTTSHSAGLWDPTSL